MLASPEELERKLTAPGAPYELVTLERNGVPIKCFKHAPKDLRSLLLKASKYGERPFLREAGVDASHSYSAVFGRAAQIAESVNTRFGSTPVHLGVCVGNSVESVAIFLGVLLAGKIPVLIPPQKAARLGSMLARMDCVALLAERRQMENLADPSLAFCPHIVVDVDWPAAAGGDAVTATAAEVTPSLDSEALVTFSSGTTGGPKGISLTERGIITGLMNMMLGGSLAGMRRPVDRKPEKGRPVRSPCVLMVSPLSHAGGYMQVLLQLMLGGQIILARNWSVPDVLAEIHQNDVRSLVGISPAMIRDLVAAVRQGQSLATISNFNINGYGASRGMVDSIHEALPHVIIGTGYGLTETNGTVSSIDGDDLKSNPLSSGRVLPTVEVKVLDRDGKPCLPDAIGEIWVRGAMTMAGYYGVGGVTPLEQGWLNTGDLGCLSPDRQIHIDDREQNYFSVDGGILSYRDLNELVAQAFPLQEVSVFAFEPRPGMKQVALVFVPSPGREVDAVDLKAFVAANLHLSIDEITSIPCAGIPHTESGKLAYGGLRELASDHYLREHNSSA